MNGTIRTRENAICRWDHLIEESTRCLNRLLELAGCRRRNYIIDQVWQIYFWNFIILKRQSQGGCESLVLGQRRGKFRWKSRDLALLLVSGKEKRRWRWLQWCLPSSLWQSDGQAPVGWLLLGSLPFHRGAKHAPPAGPVLLASCPLCRLVICVRNYRPALLFSSS